MIYIGKYEELIPGKGFPMMKDHLESRPYEGKEKIVQYLESGTVDMVRMQKPVDVFTGKAIGNEMIGMNDGVFTWFNTLVYYVKEYNLRLPKEIEEKILN